MIGKKKLKRAALKGTPCIIFAFIAFAFALQGALAQTATVTTDSSSYSRGALVTISGTITPASGGVYVGIEVRGPGGGTVWIDMVQTNPSGDYVSQFRLDPDAAFGVYIVYATPQGSSSTSWCEFTVPETVATTTRTIMIVTGTTVVTGSTTTATAANVTVTESPYTFTIGTTETKTRHKTVSVTSSVTLTKTWTTRETGAVTLTETETTTASTTVGEPIWHRIQFGLMILIPFLLVGMALGILLSRVLRRRRKAKPTIVDL